MKKVLSLLLLFTVCLYSQSPVFKQIRFSSLSETQANTIQLQGIDLECLVNNRDGSYSLIISDRECKNIEAVGISYSIEVPDMLMYYETLPKLSEAERNAVIRDSKERFGVEGFGYGTMGGYYTFAEIHANLDSMCAQFPNLITQKFMIGSSTLEKPIWAVKISDNPNVNENEPHVFFDGLIHAREPQSMATVMYYMWYLLENYRS